MVGLSLRAQAKWGWAGIDLGAHCVKVAQVVRTPLGPRLAAAATAPRTPGDATRVGPELGAGWSDAVSTARDLAASFHGRAAAATTTMAVCELHLLERARKTSEGAVSDEPWEGALSTLATAPLAELAYALWPAGGPHAASRKHYALCLRRAASDAAVSAVTHSRWRCRTLDGLPFAAARGLALTQPDPAAASEALLDWGAATALLTWGERGVPLHARVLKVGGTQALLHDVAAKLGLTPREAERLVRRADLRAQQSRATAAAADVVRARLTSVAEEVRRTLGYWKLLTRGAAPTAVVLAGGGALVAGAAHRLSELLDLPVRMWDLPATAPHAPIADACLFACAAGLSALGWGDL